MWFMKGKKFDRPSLDKSFMKVQLKKNSRPAQNSIMKLT